MRKRRRLANKMTIMVCAVLLAVSAFFYAPMEVKASGSNELTFSDSLYVKSDEVISEDNLTQDEIMTLGLDFDSSSDITSTTGYFARPSFSKSISLADYIDLNLVDDYVYSVSLTSTYTLSSSQPVNFYNIFSNWGNSLSLSVYNSLGSTTSNTWTSERVFTLTGAQLKKSYNLTTRFFITRISSAIDTTLNYSINLVVNSVERIDLYDAGYDDAMAKVSAWGADTFDYPKLVKTYSNTSGKEQWVIVNKDYVKDYDLNYNFASSDFGINPNHTYKFVVNVEGLDAFSNSECPCEWYGERFYMAVGSSKFIIRSSGKESVFFVPGYNMSSSFYLGCYVPNMIALSSTDYGYGEFCFAFDSYEISLYDMGPGGDTQNHIANQTDKLNENADKNTDTMVNGFDNTQGDDVNADLSAGLNEYQTAEDSLFATATTGMKDFTFFDIESVPAMVTGISFITATMTGWFNQAGGASGVGIVLSILFSVMLVAMVLGLYRWYQSRGGKD